MNGQGEFSEDAVRRSMHSVEHKEKICSCMAWNARLYLRKKAQNIDTVWKYDSEMRVKSDADLQIVVKEKEGKKRNMKIPLSCYIEFDLSTIFLWYYRL